MEREPLIPLIDVFEIEAEVLLTFKIYHSEKIG
jgi:hypothetical protein